MIPQHPGSADGGPQGDTSDPLAQLTQTDLKTMTSDEIVAAKEAGQLNDLLGIT